MTEEPAKFGNAPSSAPTTVPPPGGSAPSSAAARMQENTITYSSASLRALTELSADFLEDLTTLAVRVARRQHLDSVSAAHVLKAHDVLREMDYRRRGMTDFLLALGSFGLGTSVTLWVALLSKALPFTVQNGLVAAIAGAVGLGLLVYASLRAK